MITYPYVEMLCMFTSLIDHVLTYVLALMIIFSHVYLLSWSYISRFTYFDVHILLYSQALIITTLLCSHVLIIICPMSICFDEKISTCLCVLILICLNTFLIACSYGHMLCWSHAPMFTCLNDSMVPCLHTLLITCPLACMPSSSYAWTHWWLPSPMLKCFVCSQALLIMRSHMYLLWW